MTSCTWGSRPTFRRCTRLWRRPTRPKKVKKRGGLWYSERGDSGKIDETTLPVTEGQEDRRNFRWPGRDLLHRPDVAPIGLRFRGARHGSDPSSGGISSRLDHHPKGRRATEGIEVIS